MGVFYETIPPSISKWIPAQKMFLVATSPLSDKGHVNVSPKGGPYFGVIDERTFWYLDLTGSGSETISHLYENGRITIMFLAFDGPPKIIRLWGKGRVLENGSEQFEQFRQKHDITTITGSRSFIIVDIHQVGSSCGFSVPLYDFKEFRTTLNDHYKKKEERFLAGNEKESMPRYWAYKNAWSMDNLPGSKIGLETAQREKIAPMKKMVGPNAPKPYSRTRNMGNVFNVCLAAVLAFILGFLARDINTPMSFLAR